MSKGFDMLRDYIEHDSLCMRRRKCCDFEYELQQEFAALEAENASLRGAVHKYKAENAKLRACLGDSCADCAVGMGEYADSLCDPLKAENAKLRELMSVVYGYYASGTISPCDICGSTGCQYVGEAESGCRYRGHFDSAEAADDEIQRRMRELGIEVE